MPSANMPRRYYLRLLAALHFMLAANVVSAGELPSAESSPKAVNLSRLLDAPIPSNVRPIAFEQIDNSMGAIGLMLSAHPRGFGDPEVLSVGGKNDKALISANRQIVSRLGKALVIQRENGNSIRFLDWSTAGGSDHEGDSESFLYAGALGNSGYLKVDAFYGHDAPGSFLINPKSGATLFVHSGSDLVSVSKNHRTLMTMNSGLNPPFGILVVSLNEAGYDITVRCQGSGDRRTSPKIIPFFTGWHVDPFIGFDLTLMIQQLDSGTTPRYEAIPVRFSQKDSTWHVSVPEPQRFAQASRLACW